LSKHHTPLDVALATAETLSHRLPILWWEMLAPSPKGNAEISKMVIEKQMAFAEGIHGLQMEMVKQAFRPWWLWTAQQSQDLVKDLAHAATSPASVRVKANAKRLRRG
jgi:hypothetical protein